MGEYLLTQAEKLRFMQWCDNQIHSATIMVNNFRKMELVDELKGALIFKEELMISSCTFIRDYLASLESFTIEKEPQE